MKTIVLVGLGGLIGSVSRFLIGEVLSVHSQGGLPIHTLIINLAGSFLIGAFLFLTLQRPPNSIYYFLIPGLLGGFTTYSTFSGETFYLLKNSLYKEGSIYIVLTIVGGLIATASGFWLGRAILKLS